MNDWTVTRTPDHRFYGLLSKVTGWWMTIDDSSGNRLPVEFRTEKQAHEYLRKCGLTDKAHSDGPAAPVSPWVR